MRTGCKVTACPSLRFRRPHSFCRHSLCVFVLFVYLHAGRRPTGLRRGRTGRCVQSYPESRHQEREPHEATKTASEITRVRHSYSRAPPGILSSFTLSPGHRLAHRENQNDNGWLPNDICVTAFCWCLLQTRPILRLTTHLHVRTWGL